MAQGAPAVRGPQPPAREQEDDARRGVPIPRWLEWGAAYSWRLLLVVGAVVVVAITLSRLVVVVVPVVVATMFATVLVPPARWLRRHGWPALAATWAVFLTAVAMFAGLLLWLVPTMTGEFSSLGRNATRGVHKVQHWLVTGPLHLSAREVRHAFNQVGHYFSSHASGLALQGATLVAEIVVGLLITLVATFFFVKDGEKIAAAVVHLVGERHAAHCRALGNECWATITGYVRGNTINGVVNGVLMGVGVFAVGVPLAVPIGVLTFFGAYFPIVGSIVSGTLAALVALVANGPTAALVVVAITIAVHNLEAYLIGPLVLGRAVHLHPLAVLLALAAGTVIAGVVGAFVAVPVTALVTTIVNYYRNATGPRIELSAPQPPPG